MSENYAAPLAATNSSNYAPHPEQDDHTTLFGIVTFILAIFVGGLYLLNINLKRLAEEKRGIPPQPHIPVYRNKYYIAAFCMLVFMALGWWLVELGVGLGRQQGYQPQQPIFFSHRVHVGLNQINCLLCHGNAWESRHATVPSPNVCMNCHAAITDYHGEKLTRPDGSRVDPNEEIRKLYSYTGYDPDKGRYTRPGDPFEWVKIHNLPDLAYFNHAQHVRVGKVQCQTCHGPIQGRWMRSRQFADLSMGWCINCTIAPRKSTFPAAATAQAACTATNSITAIRNSQKTCTTALSIPSPSKTSAAPNVRNVITDTPALERIRAAAASPAGENPFHPSHTHKARGTLPGSHPASSHVPARSA